MLRVPAFALACLISSHAFADKAPTYGEHLEAFPSPTTSTASSNWPTIPRPCSNS